MNKMIDDSLISKIKKFLKSTWSDEKGNVEVEKDLEVDGNAKVNGTLEVDDRGIFSNGIIAKEDTTSTTDSTTYNGNHISRVRLSKVGGTSASYNYELPDKSGILAITANTAQLDAENTFTGTVNTFDNILANSFRTSSDWLSFYIGTINFGISGTHGKVYNLDNFVEKTSTQDVSTLSSLKIYDETKTNEVTGDIDYDNYKLAAFDKPIANTLEKYSTDSIQPLEAKKYPKIFSSSINESRRATTEKCAYLIPLTLEEKKARWRKKREDKCFKILDRSKFWYDSLTADETKELKEWYNKWLNVTETLEEPETPKWLIETISEARNEASEASE